MLAFLQRRAITFHRAPLVVVRGSHQYSNRCTGLLEIPELSAANGFEQLTKKTMIECETLKSRVLEIPASVDTLHALDDISNSLCSVIDVAELIRNVHPDSIYRSAADTCFTELSGYIQELNANVDLYTSLRSVTENEKLMNTFTVEQKRMASLLRAEFERDGIHLSLTQRQQVIELQNDILKLGMLFQQNIHTKKTYIQVPGDTLYAAPMGLLEQCEIHDRTDLLNRHVKIPTDVSSMNTVLKWVRDPVVRKQMYIAGNTCCVENLEVLDQLMAKRHELAQLLGFDTYAHLSTSDKMAETPEDVDLFLQSLAERLMTKAKKEKQVLLQAKRQLEGSDVNEIYGWDIPYYMGMLKAWEFHLDSRNISNYFPLDRCLEGLNLVCNSLFEMTLSQVPPTSSNEVWHPDVQKMQLVHETEGVIGYIYLDLYPRPDKYNHAAHFTIRCGRTKGNQVPVVALVTNFTKPGIDQPSLLSHAELETLFHEFGHAIHSLLSRTEFQHLSGTRTQLDFVETPSHLFEYFAWDHRVVRKFAKHYLTDEPIPEEMMQNLRLSKNMFGAMDAQTQTLYSLLDMELFQGYPLAKGSSTSVLQQIQDQYTLIPYYNHTYWHSRFGHLVGYGAGYYSYLYARVFAAHIWESCFSKDPLNPKSGNKLYTEMLKHGGAKDPMQMITKVANDTKPSMASFLTELDLQ